jgi:hypothetical protein
VINRILDSESALPKVVPAIDARPERKARPHLRTITDRLAGSNMYFRNWRWPEAARDFPAEPWMRSVAKCYPDAIGGPILIDEPQIEKGDDGKAHPQIIACERRAEVLRKHGYRYIILKKGMSEADAREELERWPGRQS